MPEPDFTPPVIGATSERPDGFSVGDVVTLNGYYERHADTLHVYTDKDILILWRVTTDGLERIVLPRKIPKTRKRLIEERPWWDMWQAQQARRS